MRWVFVGGCPRSGTTLVGSLLGAPPGVLTVPESQFKRDLALLENFDLPTNRAIIEASLPFRIWNLGEGYLEQVPPDADLRDLLNGMARTFAEQRGWDREPDLVVDHTPSNLRAEVASALAEALPDSLFIHVVRDPRGVVNSIRKADWGPIGIRASGDWWLSWTTSTRKGADQLGSRAMTVRYEDILHESGATLGRLWRFINDSDWSADVGAAEAVPIALDRSRDGAWSGELPAFATREIVRRTGSRAKSIGYDLPPSTRRQAAHRLLVEWDAFVSLLRSVTTQRARYRRRRASVVKLLAPSEQPRGPSAH